MRSRICMKDESGKMTMLQVSFCLASLDATFQSKGFGYDHGEEAYENKLKVSFQCIDICDIR